MKSTLSKSRSITAAAAGGIRRETRLLAERRPRRRASFRVPLIRRRASAILRPPSCARSSASGRALANALVLGGAAVAGGSRFGVAALRGALDDLEARTWMRQWA